MTPQAGAGLPVADPIEVAADPWAVGAFVAYLVLVVAIGIYATRFSSAGVAEFFIGGRRMNRFVVALSAVVSGRSAWLLLGVTGMAYAMGPSATWAVVGYIVAELLLFLYYAPRLRRFGARYDCITVPDFFAARFADERGTIRVVLVPVILLFMVGYVAGQFVGGGKAFAAGFGLTPTTGVLITAGIVLAYTMLGGFLAVSLTDMIQACFMIFALVLLPVVAIVDRGGMGIVLSQLASLDPALIESRMYELVPAFLLASLATVLVSLATRPPAGADALMRAMRDEVEQSSTAGSR